MSPFLCPHFSYEGSGLIRKLAFFFLKIITKIGCHNRFEKFCRLRWVVTIGQGTLAPWASGKLVIWSFVYVSWQNYFFSLKRKESKGWKNDHRCKIVWQLTLIRVHFTLYRKMMMKNVAQLKKTRVCTGTRGRSETSLNTFVHENVKVYMNQYMKFFLSFLKFFLKLSSAYIFINCTNLSKCVKFVKIVFYTYLIFFKL